MYIIHTSTYYIFNMIYSYLPKNPNTPIERITLNVKHNVKSCLHVVSLTIALLKPRGPSSTKYISIRTIPIIITLRNMIFDSKPL